MRRPTTPTRAAALRSVANTGTTLCGHPDDKWGWAVISGTEIKLDMLSPGSRVGGYFNYGVGASAYGGGSNLASPGLYGSGNQIAFGAITDGVYVNGSAIEQTTSWTVGAGFEYFWTRNFSSTIYGNYTEVSYNNTVTTNRWFCNGGGGVGTGPFSGRPAIPASNSGRSAPITTGSRCRVCGLRST